MEAVFVIVIVVAALYAVRGGGRGVKNAYDKRMANWEKSHPNAPKTFRRAAMAGQAAAMLRHGGPALVAGAKQGWHEGWARGRDWADRHHPPAEDLTPTDTAPTGETIQTCIPQDPPPEPSSPTGARPPLRAVPDLAPTAPLTPTPAPVVPPTPASGSGPVPAGQVEVTDPESLLAQLKAKLDRARDERIDAASGAHRAKAEQQLTAALLAQARVHKLPDEHMDLLAALQDPESATTEACRERHTAADAQVAAATRAVAMAAQHVQLQAAGAAGGFYRS